MSATRERHRTSLRSRTLLPGLAVALLLLAVTFVAMEWISTRHVERRREVRARMIAHLIADVTRGAPDGTRLEPLVRAMGSEDEIDLIAVVAGDPPRVVASTREEWSDREVASLDAPAVRDEVAHARATHRERGAALPRADAVSWTVPLGDDSPARLTDAVVVLHFNARTIHMQVDRWVRSIFLLLIAVVAAGFVAAEVLVRRAVLAPIAAIVDTVERRRAGERDAVTPVHAEDEIGRLARTLDAASQQVLATSHQLEYQLFVLDQAAIVSVTDPQGRIVYVNDRFCALCGYSREELIGSTHEILRSGEQAESYFEGLQAAVNEGRVWKGEFCDRARDGSTYWVSATVIPSQDAEGRLERVTAAYHDITDRKREEAQARASEQRTRLVIDTALDAVITMDARGFISGWNTQAERTFGWAAADVIGRRLSDTIVPAHFRGAHERGLERHRRTGEGSVLGNRIEITALRRDGTEIPVELAINALPGDDGPIYSAFVRDISERKHAETELVRAKESALAANRAKSEFLATMSHEIRTPMNGVIGFTDLLLESSLDPTQREYAETIRSSGVALLGLINDILDFSKIEAGRLDLENEPFDARRAAAEAVELLAAKAAENRLELVFDWPDEVPTRLVGDAMRFRQVLLNLAGNAIKFTSSGTITIRVEQPLEGRLRLVVRDTGIGIAADKLPALFRKFTQADSSTTRRFGGTGLGLAISKQLVEMMGGEIGVESRLGEGSTFWFTLPRLTVAEPEPAAPQEVSDREELEGLRVLVVDDVETNRRVLVKQLGAWGAHAHAAPGGAEALEMLRAAATAGGPFDVMLADLRMPGMDGEALARAVLAEPTLGAPGMLLLTSGSYRTDVASLRTLGFAAVLMKPLVRPELLRRALADVARERRDKTASADAPANAPTPGAAAPAAAEATPSSTIPATLFTGVRVLVAEDQIVNQRLAMRVLQRAGCDVDVAANGLEASEMAALHDYDLVFMDCHMPVRDGFEATQAIRAMEAEAESRGRARRRLPIVALTASVLQADRDRCHASGMDDFISKPFRPEQLYAALARWTGDGSERPLREAA